ncbi:hypothetical protein [Actinoplanes sp. NPDC051494]|uniref:hypothetical protein n=1 Tax=Actinoplanes sp. NPDC051494 TaxID=3363907 RepID=UPI003797D68E
MSRRTAGQIITTIEALRAEVAVMVVEAGRAGRQHAAGELEYVQDRLRNLGRDFAQVLGVVPPGPGSPAEPGLSTRGRQIRANTGAHRSRP